MVRGDRVNIKWPPSVLVGAKILGYSQDHRTAFVRLDDVSVPADEVYSPMPTKDDKFVVCSFCGKSNEEVAKIIAGHVAYICDECIGICNEILEDDKKSSTQRTAAPQKQGTKKRASRKKRKGKK